MARVTKKPVNKKKPESKPKKEVQVEANGKGTVKHVQRPIKLKTILKKKHKEAKLTAVPKLSRDSTLAKKKKKEDPEAPSVYLVLRNVPFGFFEEEAFKYFSQYGDVTKVIVLRNKKGGFSGKLFVAFKYPEVAAVVETVMHKSIMLKENVINCQHLKNKDVPVYVKYAMRNVTKDKSVIIPPKLSKSEKLKQKLDHAYSYTHVDKPEVVAEFINKQLAKAKEAGYDYKFDFSTKLQTALETDKKDLKIISAKIDKWLKSSKVQKIAKKLKIEV